MTAHDRANYHPGAEYDPEGAYSAAMPRSLVDELNARPGLRWFETSAALQIDFTDFMVIVGGTADPRRHASRVINFRWTNSPREGQIAIAATEDEIPAEFAPVESFRDFVFIYGFEIREAMITSRGELTIYHDGGGALIVLVEDMSTLDYQFFTCDRYQDYIQGSGSGAPWLTH